MTEKAYGYLRVSGKGQVNGHGFDRQEQSIRDYASKNGLVIEKIYREEGVSGTLENRPALAEMMLSLEKNGHGIQTVLIEKIDRLARDLMVQEAIINDFQRKGFKLISALEGPNLLSEDPTRILVRQVLGAIAEYDKSITVMKLKAARDRARLLRGKCEGRKSYAEAMPEVVREIRRLRRKRKGQGHMSYTKVAEELNSRGMSTMTGKPWTGQAVQDLLRNL
ncbi:Resolvase, N-terminal domain protein [uncultured Desulfobacterium sp.]|uniref:Resolvase, N-terminal domain protein n=1 Tax=uncultured Desulfobacterium sp. TaxID=201089 RepID=A0A445N1U2_9BACT|nr:Resolvase, N-terminal domain protein [uncultured Desulfobacterium sp.]